MVNVNQVYQTVLYILNKEQRGYLTPAEFNKVATQVQLEIFEQYFEELNQALRMPDNDSEYANRVKNLNEKIGMFETHGVCTTTASPLYSFPDDLHRIGSITYKDKLLQEMSRRDYVLINKSPFTKPTESFPAYVLDGLATPFAPAAPGLKMDVYPDTISSDLPIFYIRKPLDVVWAYKPNTQGGYVYQEAADPAAIPNTGSVQFGLHPTEQVNIILNILMYSGVIIRDQQIVQTASAMIQQDTANEKT